MRLELLSYLLRQDAGTCDIGTWCREWRWRPEFGGNKIRRVRNHNIWCIGGLDVDEVFACSASE